MKIQWWAKVREVSGHSIKLGPFISQEDAWEKALENQDLTINAPIEGTFVWCTKQISPEPGNKDESLPINRKPRRHNDK